METTADLELNLALHWTYHVFTKTNFRKYMAEMTGFFRESCWFVVEEIV